LKVSILIPCFNAERWIGQTIETALAQTWSDKELIVVDDGSTDGSLDVIKRYGDRVRWETGPNRGGGAARNRLLELAQGNWLQYLDADDWLMPDKIAHQMAFLNTHAAADVLYGPVIIEHWSETHSWREALSIPEPRDPWILLARWFLPQTGAVIWRKQAILDVGGWKVDQPCCQEHELYLRLLMAGKPFVYTEAAGAVYRQWSEMTLCKRDRFEVARRRLEVLKSTEVFLAERRELTPERRQALNIARLEIARGTWKTNRNFAGEIVRTILASKPDFSPTGSPATPRLYRIAFKTFGFEGAEWSASITRGIREKVRALRSLDFSPFIR
jgi:glycosyltransferase involved in cell wall biosynthesis